MVIPRRAVPLLAQVIPREHRRGKVNERWATAQCRRGAHLVRIPRVPIDERQPY
jgi:hypothetical protein